MPRESFNSYAAFPAIARLVANQLGWALYDLRLASSSRRRQ